jgi:PAS domain S-box-containing protein
MKNLFKPASVLIFLALAFSPSSPSAAERATIVGSKSYAPFFFLDAAGEPAGIWVDTWRLWSEKTGVEVGFVSKEWGKALKHVAEGDGDVIAGFMYSPERDEIFDYSESFYEVAANIFFHNSIYGLRSLKELSGFKIGVVKDDYAETYIKQNLADAHVVTYPGFRDLVDGAVSGEVRVFVADTPIVLFHLARHGHSQEFKVSRDPLYSMKIFAGVKEGNRRLLDIVNEGLGSISEDEKRLLDEKWIGRPAGRKFPWQGIGFAAVFLLCVIAATFLWVFLLRKKVAASTQSLMLSRQQLEKSRAAIQEAHDQLERRVNERTRELAEANTDLLEQIAVRKRAENALRKSEETFSAVFRHGQFAMGLCDTEGKLLRFNPAFEKLMGYTAAELEKMHFRELTHEEDRVESMRHFRRLTSGEVDQFAMEKRYVRKDGSIVWGHIGVSPIHDPDGGMQNTIFMLADITGRMEAEEEKDNLQRRLLQAQKMEAIGRLAGGMAHDFNNLLTVIRGYAELALMQMSDSSAIYPNIREIDSAAESAASLTSQLLAFSRKQILQPSILQLNDVIRKTGKMLERLIGEDIELITNLGTGTGTVLANMGQMEQVIMNLAVNARDAMPNGGTLTIATRNVELDADRAGECGVQPGEYVLLLISDTGSGMDKETQSLVFEPFFTTKGKGIGTGLGLATVYGIVRQSSGCVVVDSDVGKGATFSIYLPRAAGPSGEEKIVASEEELRGSETVLVVEDEEKVRGVVCSMLDAYGYSVLEADSGEQALRTVRELQGPLHLVLTDIVMTGLNGPDTVAQLQEMRPGLQAIFMSGYSDDAILNQTMDPDHMFLQKPITPHILFRKIREKLEGTSPGT